MSAWRIRTDRRKATDVIDVLSDLFILRGVPGHIRSDNGPEFVAKAVQEWIAAVGARTAYIALGSPWENGCVESFNARLRDELLDGEIFYKLKEAQIVIEPGGATTTQCAPVLLWATSRRHPKCSCLPLPRGRLHALNMVTLPSFLSPRRDTAERVNYLCAAFSVGGL